MAPRSMKEAGWVWEGIGFDPGVLPTVYGVGEGMEYFGVEGATLIFHPNTPTNLAKLSRARRVTADISKWIWFETKAENGRFTFAQTRDDSPTTVAAEAENVSRLSLEFQNLTGAFIDDTHGVAAHGDYTPDSPKAIKEAVRRHNDGLDLEIVVYTHELGKPYWGDWIDAVDAVSLWVWESANLPNIDAYLSECRRVFPTQRINMGVYIRDYALPGPVPLDMLTLELEAIRRHLNSGELDGYSILGNCLIDQHPEQAQLIREFIGRSQ